MCNMDDMPMGNGTMAMPGMKVIGVRVLGADWVEKVEAAVAAVLARGGRMGGWICNFLL